MKQYWFYKNKHIYNGLKANTNVWLCDQSPLPLLLCKPVDFLYTTFKQLLLLKIYSHNNINVPNLVVLSLREKKNVYVKRYRNAGICKDRCHLIKKNSVQPFFL